MHYLTAFGQHWFGIVIILHVMAFIVQNNLIWPFEVAIFGDMGSLASVLFLPHTVRVLSTWLLGPKAFFALFPAALFAHYLYAARDYDVATFILIPFWSSASAIIAFEFLKFVNMDVYPKNAQSISWRSLVFAGCLASFFNSIGGTYLKSEGLTVPEVFELLIRYFVGDIGGLLFCMFVLMLILRYNRLRNSRNKIS